MKTIKSSLSYFVQLAAVLFMFSSCNDHVGHDEALPAFTSGMFVVCEGNFNSGNASVSHYNNGSVTNDIFNLVNHRPLGDQAQSMVILGDNAYILVQNSGKIEVVNATSFSTVARIDAGISSPRYMVGYTANVAYVSDWTSNQIKIIDLTNNTVSDSIAVDEVPEGLLIKGNKLYVSNTGLNYGVGTHISIIDLTTNTKTGSITTPGNPAGMVEDADGNIWALCGGDEWTSVNAALIKIDPSTNTITTTVNFAESGDYPYHLYKNATGNKLYYTIGGQIFEFPITATTEPSTPLIARSFYGFGVNTSTGDFIGLISPNFTSSGKVVRYSSAGVKLDSAIVGIAPGSVVFK